MTDDLLTNEDQGSIRVVEITFNGSHSKSSYEAKSPRQLKQEAASETQSQIDYNNRDRNSEMSGSINYLDNEMKKLELNVNDSHKNNNNEDEEHENNSENDTNLHNTKRDSLELNNDTHLNSTGNRTQTSSSNNLNNASNGNCNDSVLSNDYTNEIDLKELAPIKVKQINNENTNDENEINDLHTSNDDPEINKFISDAIEFGANALDLSKKKLYAVPKLLFRLDNLQVCFYLIIIVVIVVINLYLCFFFQF